uniref:Uncharacterized protein n=1 Tax=Candidatus Kentrum eta TaxID=2126337 RepID=A0A450VJ00_9GAMM|nr:MAG: hypothetical protein BECKH772A_GA0070896_104611 [Candidatus Kentron sp. H]VFK07541.1 MAG: hypothetical protein BECKH772C_GA0070978_104301 [Candidatus Kentron sp. H]
MLAWAGTLITTITMRLPSNSGFVDSYCIGGLSLGMACFHQGRYPVSLLSGKLRVCAHLCLSFQSERKVMMLTRLALYIRTHELHLQVESRKQDNSPLRMNLTK